MTTLSFAGVTMVAMVIALVVLLVVVLIRAIKVASGRGARRESGGESAMLSVALQDALNKLRSRSGQPPHARKRRSGSPIKSSRG